jgi:hypothetical protein
MEDQMSKATKRSTTKAKAVTKAKLAKPEGPGDAVSVLLASQRRHLLAIEALRKRSKAETAQGHEPWYGRMECAVFDRASMAIDELSYLKPKTCDGAVFALISAFATVKALDGIKDADFRERRKRRANRLLFGVLRYLIGETRFHSILSGCDPKDNLSLLVREYMPPWEDPRHNLEIGRPAWDWPS